MAGKAKNTTNPGTVTLCSQPFQEIPELGGDLSVKWFTTT